MNRRSFIRAMLPAFVACLLVVVSGGNASSHLEELLSLNLLGGPGSRTVTLEIPIKASAREDFLATPVNTLRSQGIHVPEAAEAPWREFTQALRSLTNGPRAGRATNNSSSVGREALHYRIVLREAGLVLYLGTGEPNAADMRTAQKFLADPIGTLRSHGVHVLTADEGEWKRLADSLKALRLAYAKSRSRIEPQDSSNSESSGRTRLPGRGAEDKVVGIDRRPNPTPDRIRITDAKAGQTSAQAQRLPRIPRKPAASDDLATGTQPTFNRRQFMSSMHDSLRPRVMGYSFLLMKDGRVMSEGAGGLARNAADGEMEMTTRTPQNLGSLFKFITGVTVLHMLDRAPAGSAGGNNSFDTRLNAPVTLLYPQLWNSSIKWPTVRSITFRHLLQHKSGFRACKTPLGCFEKRYNDTLFGVRDYENINFQLLGFLIPLYTNPELIPALNAVTRTVGEDEGDHHIQMVLSDRMDRFMREKVFPLAPGKISASCDAANEYKTNGAYGYISKTDQGNGIITSRKAGDKPCVGSGGYWMSIRDFGAFVAAALHSDRILSEQVRLQMYRTGMPADDRLVWSFTGTDSWIADKFKMSTIILSNGSQPYDGGQGFSTVLLRLPLNYELIVFVNSKGMNTDELAIAGYNAFRAGME